MLEILDDARASRREIRCRGRRAPGKTLLGQLDNRHIGTAGINSTPAPMPMTPTGDRALRALATREDRSSRCRMWATRANEPNETSCPRKRWRISLRRIARHPSARSGLPCAYLYRSTRMARGSVPLGNAARCAPPAALLRRAATSRRRRAGWASRPPRRIDASRATAWRAPTAPRTGAFALRPLDSKPFLGVGDRRGRS